MQSNGDALVRLGDQVFSAKLDDARLPADVAGLMRATMAQMPWLTQR